MADIARGHVEIVVLTDPAGYAAPRVTLKMPGGRMFDIPGGRTGAEAARATMEHLGFTATVREH